jgi:hypothetical protein
MPGFTSAGRTEGVEPDGMGGTEGDGFFATGDGGDIVLGAAIGGGAARGGGGGPAGAGGAAGAGAGAVAAFAASFSASIAASFSSTTCSLVRTKALADGAAIGAAGVSFTATSLGAAASVVLLPNSSFKDSAEILSTVLEALFT